jgi:hypothetical protein
MNEKMTTAIPLIFLLCFAIFTQVSAQTQVPGVKYGDYFIFSIISQWNSSNSSATIPAFLSEINNTAYYKVLVESVIGSNVTATNIWHLTNNTDINSLVILNVDSGSMFYMNGYKGFFYSNLAANDLLRPSGADGIRINQTISRDYGSGSRETNMVTFSYNVTDAGNSTIGIETATLYIDKATGVLVGRDIHSEFPDQSGSEIWTLTETNLWTVTSNNSWSTLPQPLIIAIIIVVIIATVSILVFYKLRKSGRRKSRR